MAGIECFTGTRFQKQFEDAIGDEKDEAKQRAIGRELALKLHEKYHADIADLRKQLSLPTKEYAKTDLEGKAAEVGGKFDEQIKQTKADNPEPPSNNPPVIGTNSDPSNQNGIGISKQAVLDQYGVHFEKTPIGWDEVTKTAVGRLTDEAIRKGTSVELEAESQVNQMAEDIANKKLAVSEDKIVTAAVHLINLDSRIDDVQNREAKTEGDLQNKTIELKDLEDKRLKTLEVIDKMGSKSGRNLGLYAGIFSKNADGGFSAYRKITAGVFGMKDMPATIDELEKSDLSKSDKDKIIPYIEKIEQLKKEYDAGIRAAKSLGKTASPKSATQRVAKAKKAADKLRTVANNVRNSKEFEKWGLGKPIEGQAQGLTFNVQEHLAAALDHIADAIENGAESLDKLIKEAAAKFKGESDEKDFEGALNHVLKQEKELEDFRFGIIDVNKDAVDAAVNRQQMRTLGQLKALAQQAQDSNSGYFNTLTDYRRSFLIGGFKTLIRVGESGISKFIVDPIAKLSAGNIVSLLPGLKKQAVSLKTSAEGVESLIKFKDDKTAIEYADKKTKEFDEASKALKADPLNKSLQQKYMDAEMENAKADIYRWIHSNTWEDTKELAKTGSTEFEQSMGGWAKEDPTVLRGMHKYLYVLNSLARLHGVEKNPSARRALVETYNNKLLEYKKDGIPLSASTRMRALNMAYEQGFLPGKYQNPTELSNLTNRFKYMGDTKQANFTEKVIGGFLKLALPVSKVPINIVKGGVDMSSLGIEGIVRYMWNTNKNLRGLNEISETRKGLGMEYNNIWQNLHDAAKDIPEKERAYIHSVLTRGLFGLGLYAYAAWGVSNGTIRYGGSYEDRTAKRKYKGADGEWHDDLEYGQWVINGVKFGKDMSKLFNHLPEFLPIALAANTHNVYQYEHEYKGVNGDRETKSSGRAFWEAIKSDINEVTEKLPYGNVTKPSDVLTGIISIPAARDIGEQFDKDANGNLIERKAKNPLETVEMNLGLRKLVPKKEKKNEFQ